MPPLLLLCLAWMGGLALARLPEPRVALLWLAAGLALVLLHGRRLPVPWPLACLLLIVALGGLWRGLPPARDAIPPLPAGIQAVRGTVTTWPRRHERTVVAVIQTREVATRAGWQPVEARIEAYLPLFPEVSMGDAVEADGRLRSLTEVAAPRVGQRLHHAGLAGQMTARRLVVRSTVPPDGWATWRERSVDAITEALDRHLPLPVSALAAGMLIGDRRALPPDLRAAFVTTGTVHLLVVSGWNITLVVMAIAWVGTWLRTRHRLVWLPLTLTGVALYTVLVGADPAVVRAALMGGLAVVALALGRRADPVVALVTAAAVMTAWHPGVLVDLSFQLSFAATLGLLILLPPLTPYLTRLPWPARLVAAPFAATVAAQVAVEPLLVHTFGRFSLIAPLINVLVAPWVSLVMAGAFSVALLGMSGLYWLADLAAWVTVVVAMPLLAAVEAGALIPFASISIPPPPAMVVALTYMLLLTLALPLLTPSPRVTVLRLLLIGRRWAGDLGLVALAAGAMFIWALLFLV